ncbi:MAG: DmsC/YnfH family molybdoenzyme membrane anchor subunit [Anaeromyxobacteraceae bacterium]
MIHSPLLRLVSDSAGSPSSLVDRLLREQQTLTAVDRFARQHDQCDQPAQARYYRDLIPLERPRPGQQYAFEVDLDACTGCKACVAGCHSLNGLDEGEIWRTVGLLHGGTAEAPTQQTVTTSCHHCVEPACLVGCPVKAYEKDPVTGVVRHLDDQCIGCQYCTLMCPYDAPKYSKQKGIVRKCDMCSDRLAVGEAPACVQACPNQAIRVRVIDQVQALQASEAGAFLPGAPAPDHTVPTTMYRSARATPLNTLPADFYSASPGHGHISLVIMLVLTQLAVGAFCIGLLGPTWLGSPGSGGWSVVNAAFALALAVAAIGAATLHLGRPQYAFRAVLGLRTSWVSREAVAFGLFAQTGVLYALSLVSDRLPAFPAKALLLGKGSLWAGAAAAVGLFGVHCSVMIYAATRRSHWRAGITGVKFFGTTLILGIAAVTALTAATAAARRGSPFLASAAGRALLAFLLVTALLKLGLEASLFSHLRDRQHTVWKRIALVMSQDLRTVTAWRFVAGVTGGVVAPALCLLAGGGAPGIAVLSLLLLITGELLERYMFFKAAPASRMPGALH